MVYKCEICGEAYDAIADSWRCKEWHEANPKFEGIQSRGTFSVVNPIETFTYHIIGAHWDHTFNCARVVGVRDCGTHYEVNNQYSLLRVNKGYLREQLIAHYDFAPHFQSVRYKSK